MIQQQQSTMTEDVWKSRYYNAENTSALQGFRRQFVRELSDSFLRSLLRRVGANGRAVDIGCGTGAYTAILSDEGFDVTGVDYSPAMIEAAANQLQGCNVDLRVGSFDSLPLDDESFDVALSMGVLQHISDIQGALAETHRILRPGGRVLFEVRNRFSLFRAGQLMLSGAKYRVQDQEIRNFTPSQVKSDLRASGFSQIRLHNCVVLPPPFVPLARILHRPTPARLADLCFPLVNWLSHNFWFSAVRD